MSEAEGTGPASGTPVAELVDPDRFRAWAETNLPGAGDLEIERHAAGHSNLTFVVRRTGAPTEWVLRRPPQGPLLPTAHDVLREYRVMGLLGGAAAKVRVPTVVAACEDPDVIGVPFYLMERVEGVVIRDALPDWLADDDNHTAGRHALGLDVVDALAELHLAPYEPLVAAGIGKAEGYLQRQLKRWTGQREGVKEVVASMGGAARELPDYDVLRDWLTETLPDPVPAAVVHGDYKLDNVIVEGGPGPGADSAPRVTAIVDWEMATVGDPRADLGYLLSFWIQEGEQLPWHEWVTDRPGFPSRGELVDRWAQQTGRDPGDQQWFTALAIWKLAILLEASYYRHLAGTTDDPFFAMLDKGVPALLERAREVAGV